MGMLIVGIGALGRPIAARAIRTRLPVRLAARNAAREFGGSTLPRPINLRLLPASTYPLAGFFSFWADWVVVSIDGVRSAWWSPLEVTHHGDGSPPRPRRA